MENHKLALIIDDDDDVCVILKSILSDAFDEIEYTHSLKSGREFLIRMKPDVVFLDNNLPDGQGVYLIQEIKNIIPAPLVILITAMDNSKKEAIECGTDIFLEKPLTYTSVYHALELLYK